MKRFLQGPIGTAALSASLSLIAVTATQLVALSKADAVRQIEFRNLSDKVSDLERTIKDHIDRNTVQLEMLNNKAAVSAAKQDSVDARTDRLEQYIHRLLEGRPAPGT